MQWVELRHVAALERPQQLSDHGIKTLFQILQLTRVHNSPFRVFHGQREARFEGTVVAFAAAATAVSNNVDHDRERG